MTALRAFAARLLATFRVERSVDLDEEVRVIWRCRHRNTSAAG